MQTAAKTQNTNLENIRGAIAAKIERAEYTSWIAPLDFEIVDNTLVLTAANQFSADFINGVYCGVLNSVANEYGLGLCVRVNGARRAMKIANDNVASSYTPAPVAANKSTFDEFIASDDNVFVLNACKKVASGAVSFSPLFIYGPAGCGKTLLADCIKTSAMGRVVMMSGASFISEFTRSLASHNIFAFKDFCRNCDTFILDDVQSIAGKRASMDEFLQLVIDLRNAGKNIVLTSNVAPSALVGFDRRAQSLLASGLVADVAAPNATVKRAMLIRGGVSSAVADSISGRVANDGHAICGVVNKIQAYSELMNAPVDEMVAERLLADTLRKSRTPIAMVREMCEKMGVSYDAVCGAGRARGIVIARQTIMYVLKNATKLSLGEIGTMCGNRDHATVLYGVRQIENMMKSDLILNAQVNDFINAVR